MKKREKELFLPEDQEQDCMTGALFQGAARKRKRK